MQIDWITVSAQIVNFLILVWLLHHFLYQPVMRAMERREQRIADRLNEAQQREQQAEQQRQQYQDKQHELVQQREELLAETREQGEQEKREMLNQARDAVGKTRQNWQRQADQEKEEFLTNLRQQTTAAIQSIARKALSDLANAELQEQMVRTFLQQLNSLDKEARKALTRASEPVHIASATELEPALRGRLTRAIHETIAADREVQYTVAPDLLCGIELTSNEQRLSWNLADYMEELGQRIDQAFSATEAVTTENRSGKA